MPDASDLDAAIMNRLSSDATLRGLMPDGVFWGLAAPGASRYVLLSLADFSGTLQLDTKTAFEEYVYLIQAVANQSGGTSVKDAAARIDTLFHLQNFDLTSTGYTLMKAQHISPRIRETIPDPVDAAARWQHRGWHYSIMVTFA